MHRGSCHCGNLTVEFETARAPADVPVRECQCSFCRKHGTRAVTDPAGSLVVRAGDQAELSRYVFGLATAEYLICRRCGVYVAAITRSEPITGIVILNCLDDRAAFSSPPVQTVHDHESAEERVSRRRRSWTPAHLI
jgi:hypothetical protein